MSRKTVHFASIATAASFCALVLPTVRAAAVDSLTMTPNGLNTDFVLTGTYTPDTSVTSFSFPNSPYVLSFSLPTSPTSFAVNLDCSA